MLSRISSLSHKAKYASLKMTRWSNAPLGFRLMSSVHNKILDIEAKYPINIHKNKYQQKLWAEKLKIPETFINDYFKCVDKLKIYGMKFDKDTPEPVLKEFFSILEKDIADVYDKAQEKESYGLKDLAELIEGQVQTQPHKNLPKFKSYNKAEPSTFEQMQIEYEKDVFEAKLNVQEKSLFDKILSQNEFKLEEENPLKRDIDTYKTLPKMSEKEQDLFKYILADRSLRSDNVFNPAELSQHLENKAIGLAALKSQKDSKVAEARELRDINHINNTLLDKIMTKREQLQEKLVMLEEMHRQYAERVTKDEQKVAPVSSLAHFDFIKAFEESKQAELDASNVRYKGKNKNLHRMDQIVLTLDHTGKDKMMQQEFNQLCAAEESKNKGNHAFQIIQLNYGIAVNDANYVLQAFNGISNQSRHSSTHSTIPVNLNVCRRIFELYLKTDHFKGLGQLLNYLEQRQLNILMFDMSLFRNSMEYYQNDKYDLSRVLVYLKFYTYYQKCLFRQLDMTPEKIRRLSPVERNEYSYLLFPTPNLADFSYLVKRVGDKKIIDKHSSRDVVKQVIDYFTQYTVPFMDIPQHVHSFIRENDIADYLSNRFDDASSFKDVMQIAERYGDRTIFHEFILDHLRKYQESHRGKMPPSFSKANVQAYLERINKRLETDLDYKVDEKIYEILLEVMKSHNMIEEMKSIPSQLKPYYMTEVILAQDEKDMSGSYSSQVREMFKEFGNKYSPLYTLCMMKALLKENDTTSALRVLEAGEKHTQNRRQAVDSFYSKIYDYCFDEKNNDDRYVSFFPDLMKERQARINQEIEAAGKISQYDKNKVIEKYKKAKLDRKLPVSYSDFKKKHYNMVKTVNNYTKQMVIMDLIKKAVGDGDYRRINDLFTYLLVSKEEEQVIKNIKKEIESFEKLYDSDRKPRTLDEANDPMRLLFKYFKKPGDDLDALVGKYAAIVPSLKERIMKLKKRKDQLHRNIKGIINDTDAKFLADSNINSINDPTLLENYEQFNFNLSSQKARDAIGKMINEYERITNSFTPTEKSYNLPDIEIMKARKIHEKHPTRNYNDVLDTVSKDYRKLERMNNIEKQEKLQDLIDAGEVADSDSKDFVDSFVKRLNSGQLSDYQSIIDKLRSQYDHVLNAKDSFGNDISRSTFKDVLNDSLDSYYIHSGGKSHGFSKFINHSNGEMLLVDDAKMAKDNQYFVKTVAELAKIEMTNYNWNKEKTKESETKMINSMMKFREFRKYYYLLRKFYYQKYLLDIENGQIKIKDDNSIEYVDNYSEDDLTELKFNNLDWDKTINVIFKPPQFDILDFKEYYNKDEYNELVQQYYRFTRGYTQSDKLDYLKHKLLGDKLKEDASRNIDRRLKKLFEEAKISPGSEKSMYQVLKNVLPEDLLSETNEHRKAKELRTKYFDSKYRDEFNKLWEVYKEDRINEATKGSSIGTDSSNSQSAFMHIDKNLIDSVGGTLLEVKTLMDTVDTKLQESSDDHIAFELFDQAMLKSFSPDTRYDETEVYPNDEYERGYMTQEDMAKKFADIYEYEHPMIKSRLGIRDESSNIRSILSGGKRREQLDQNKDAPKTLVKSRNLKFADFGPKESLESKNKAAEEVVGEFIENTAEEIANRLHALKTTPVESYSKMFREKNAIASGMYTHYHSEDEQESDSELVDALQEGELLSEREYEFNKNLHLPGESYRWNDEYNIKKNTFDKTLYSMQEELKEAVKNRKEYSMSLAMELFNKIQSIELGSSATTDLAVSEESQQIIDQHASFPGYAKTNEKLTEEMTKLKVSLSDSESPSFSVIKKYHKDGILGLDEDKVQAVYEHDLSSFKEANETLEGIYEELEKKENMMIAMQDAYDQGLSHYDRKSTSNTDYVREKDEMMQNVIEKEIFDAYIEYQRDLLLQNDNYNPKAQSGEITNSHKIKVIKQIFGVMEGKLLQNFGTDLLIFGMNHDIPDAVRIGENLAALNDEHVPLHVVKDLQHYIVDNHAKLKERISVTGPMQGIIQTRKDNMLSTSDSPYLPKHYDYMMAFDKYNRWRIPSSYAGSYKKRGLWEDAFGKEKAERIEHYFPNVIQ